jgi:hypothetical protein
MLFADLYRAHSAVIALPASILLTLSSATATSTQAAATLSVKRALVGHVDKIVEDTVLLNGQPVTQGNASLRAGDVFNTKQGGSVVFSLYLKNATCTLNPDSILVVRPSKLVSTAISAGADWCYTKTSARKTSVELNQTTSSAGTGAEFAIGRIKVQPGPGKAIIGVGIHPRTMVIKVDRGVAVLTGFKPETIIAGLPPSPVVVRLGPGTEAIIDRNELNGQPRGRPRRSTIMLSKTDRVAIDLTLKSG